MSGEIDTRFRHLEAKIGLFVLLALIGCLAVVAFIAAENDLFTPQYRLRFTVDKGTGFAKGMPVKLSGFRIGRIESIALNQEAKVDVVIQIDAQYQKWIREDSLARLDKEGIVGDSIIEISAGSPAKPELRDGDVIAYEKTKTIEENVADIAEKFKPVLLEVRDIISYVNDPQGDIKQSLANIEKLTHDLQQTRGKADRLIDGTTNDIHAAAGNINALVAHADRSFSSLDTSLVKLDSVIGNVDRQLPQLLAKLDATLANAERISADLRQASGEVGPQIPLLIERVDKVTRDAGSLVNAAQDIWIFRSDQPEPTAPAVVPGDSHE